MRAFCTVLGVALALSLFSQNTVGVLSHNEDLASEGLNLFFPFGQSTVFLMNNCGEIVHQWDDDGEYRPGNSAYLLENGNLVKTKRPVGFVESSFTSGGAGGIVEILDWDNNLIWSTKILDSLNRAHHDVAPMPNGNVLVLSWERKSIEEAIKFGLDTTLYISNEIWPDNIKEYDPSSGLIVWEWHAWDHLVQDYDESKMLFNDVGENSQLIDINYDLIHYGGRPDWMHSNFIDYNPELDQILLSVAHFEEIWIIDHSTTSEEAANHIGGNAGKGGDLLFRWGNPRAYKRGGVEDQQLFFQHNAHWIDDPTLVEDSYFGDIILYNNRSGDLFSEVNILRPTIDQNGAYELNSEDKFLPSFFLTTINHPELYPMYSSGMSSVQVLPNGNFLICSANRGYIFEITRNGSVVWEYKLPFRNGFPISQGQNLNTGDNVLFKFERFDLSYPAFENKDLSPKGYLELEPNLEFCNLPTQIKNIESLPFSIFPNLSNHIFTIQNNNDEELVSIDIINSLGMLSKSVNVDNSGNFNLDVSNLSPGNYIVLINKIYPIRVVIY